MPVSDRVSHRVPHAKVHRVLKIIIAVGIVVLSFVGYVTLQILDSSTARDASSQAELEPTGFSIYCSGDEAFRNMGFVDNDLPSLTLRPSADGDWRGEFVFGFVSVAPLRGSFTVELPGSAKVQAGTPEAAQRGPLDPRAFSVRQDRLGSTQYTFHLAQLRRRAWAVVLDNADGPRRRGSRWLLTEIYLNFIWPGDELRTDAGLGRYKLRGTISGGAPFGHAPWGSCVRGWKAPRPLSQKNPYAAQQSRPAFEVSVVDTTRSLRVADISPPDYETPRASQHKWPNALISKDLSILVDIEHGRSRTLLLIAQLLLVTAFGVSLSYLVGTRPVVRRILGRFRSEE